jgi:hypothetical protein
MISREEYNKALDIVEAYHKQLFLGGDGSSLKDLANTPVLKWDKFEKCSTRLKTALRTAEHCNKYNNGRFFIETMNWKDFRYFRYAGRKSWNEFVELRGC